MKDNKQLLVRAAQLYYDAGLNQSDIATILDVSRPTVSRLIEKAREEGVVEITVHDPISKDPELSNALRDKLGLRDAVVITGDYHYEKALERCCEAAIQFLETILQDGYTIGIPWGMVPQIICDKIDLKKFENLSVTQMVGCLGTGDTNVDGIKMAIRLANKLGGTYYNIYSPIYVHNKEVSEYLLQEPPIAATLERAMNTDVIVTGIGSVDSKSTIMKAGFWHDEDLQELLDMGVAGHLLGRTYDINGELLERRNVYLVGAPLQALKNTKWSIGVAAADIKSRATIGAVRGGYINVLIADQHLAKEILNLWDTV